MYLHLGQDTVVKQKDIIGIFDLENTSVKKDTREFLKKAQKAGQVVNVSMEMPKSFCVCCSPAGGSPLVYISQISPSTLRSRWGSRGLR